mmetsp:Transcript_28300/g.79873  ORF Transcript_28300/g.79873 Transcript_28300/m.79873 type:complete len:219 (-) Transcript_28300:226-882(-)
MLRMRAAAGTGSHSTATRASRLVGIAIEGRSPQVEVAAAPPAPAPPFPRFHQTPLPSKWTQGLDTPPCYNASPPLSQPSDAVANWTPWHALPPPAGALAGRPAGDSLDRDIHSEDIDLLWSGASSKFTGINKRVHKAAACMFTNTPDENFILDLHPQHPQVVMCSACSGHGYKFASVIGEVLSQLALWGESSHDITLHRVFHPSRTDTMSVWRQPYVD